MDRTARIKKVKIWRRNPNAFLAVPPGVDRRSVELPTKIRYNRSDDVSVWVDIQGESNTFYVMYQNPSYVAMEGFSFFSDIPSGYDGKVMVEEGDPLFTKVNKKWTEKGKVKLLKPMLRGARAASTLRDRVVKLAFDNPELRPHILPMLEDTE